MPISGYPVSAHPISANIPPVVTTPTTVALDWLVRWNDPPRLKANINARQHPAVFGQNPIIPTNSWFYGLTDPTRLKRLTPYQQDTLAPVQPTPAAFTFYPMAQIEPFINVKPRVVTYGPVLSGLPIKTTPPATGGDPFFANTVLLANFNGTNG